MNDDKIDSESTEFIIASVQKANPQIKRIIRYFHMCCLYEFDMPSKKWNKLGIEGPCFIYDNGHSYQLLVLAQKSVGKFDFEIQQWKLERHDEKSMLIFKTKDKQIHSLHFASLELMEQCYNIIYNYLSVQKEKASQEKKIVKGRSYSFDEEPTMGKEKLQKLLIEALQDEKVISVLYDKLESFLGHKQK